MVSLCALSADASARRAALPQTGGWTMPAAHSSGELNDVVLRRNVLLVAIQHMNDLFAYNEQPGNNNFRHAAYRQFVLWRFGHVGSGNRVVIPSCVVWAVRDRYPSADGTYTGFKVAIFIAHRILPSPSAARGRGSHILLAAKIY